jgi:hypothetical protein
VRRGRHDAHRALDVRRRRRQRQLDRLHGRADAIGAWDGAGGCWTVGVETTARWDHAHRRRRCRDQA